MGSCNQAEIAVVGGGLVGSLLAILLRARGHAVTLYERRPDPANDPPGGGRSINLVVTRRGFRALERVGLDSAVRELTVPVLGRRVHAVDGRVAYQPYGRDDSECNYSIGREALNTFLLREAARRGTRIVFGQRLIEADLVRRRLVFVGETAERRNEVGFDLLFGADGAGSIVRAMLARFVPLVESSEPVDHVYKELVIPAADGGGFRLESDALHIWPRQNRMMMALPNLDGSFTVTVYLPRSGRWGLASIDSPQSLSESFDADYPDAVPLIPDLGVEFFRRPTGELGTLRCSPWQDGRSTLLIGDAAHAIVPFFGQGMNCGFEDCTILDGLLNRGGARDWGATFAEFESLRKPNADAIADLALDNFAEMRDRVGDDRFRLRKSVEHRLEIEMPRDYRSRYSMVMYSHIPFAICQEAGRVQDRILDELCAGLDSADALDLDRANQLIVRDFRPWLVTRAVSLDY